MATSKTESNKRRRTGSPSDSNILHINDIPNALLADVATYLPKPSRAFFAVAMTAPTSSWRISSGQELPSAAANAILSSTEWDKLDFGEVEKSLAEKLRDADLYGVLSCINAKTTLEILKLTGCINISGSGLEPLRGSLVLQQIDLSLVGHHESPKLVPEASISEVVVLPILDSIIAAHGNSLKHIQLPEEWRREGSIELWQFLEKYHNLMENRRLCCSKCNEVIQHDTEEGLLDKWYFFRSTRLYGLQKNTCCACMKHFCYGHNDGVEEDNPMNNCAMCQRVFCKLCAPGFNICDQCGIECGNGNCKDCGELLECEGCQENLCEQCLPTRECCNGKETMCDECEPFMECEGRGCSKSHCEDCFDGKDYDVEYCNVCERHFCADCRYLEFRKTGIECSGSTCINLMQEMSKKL